MKMARERLHRPLTLLGALGAILAVAGCSTVGGLGNSDFACSGMPDGITCATPIEVYEHTHNMSDLDDLRVDPDDKEKKTASKADPSAEVGKMSQEIPGETGAAAPPEVQRQLVVSPESPMPILEPAQVMRIWVAPWIDERQDLHWPGFIFTEVTPRRWQFGEEAIRAVQPKVPAHILSSEAARGTAPQGAQTRYDTYYDTERPAPSQQPRRGPGRRATDTQTADP